MQAITLTVHQAMQICRENGWQVSQSQFTDGMEKGIYPFGRLVSTGSTGRRTFEIFRGDLLRFIYEKSGEGIGNEESRKMA